MLRNQSGSGVGGSIVDLQEIEWNRMWWIAITQDRDKWQAVVDAMVELGFHQMQRNSWLAEEGLAFQEGRCSLGVS